MSLYTTPLQFGYFLALLFAVLLWYRGWHEERLSDKFLGFVMFFLAMEIQDYTFGFSGINILWEKFEGFPRYFTLAFAPTIYFYLKAQINRDFRFRGIYFLHYLPYFTYFLINFCVFVQGKVAVNHFRSSEISNWLGWLETITIWTSYIYYFYQSLRIYKEYRSWTETQFSDIETISFVWLRNFIYLIIAGEVFKWCWFAADYIIDLPFEKDWWWHLFTVVIICYVGIKGYAQHQPLRLTYNSKSVLQEEIKMQNMIETPTDLKEEQLAMKLKIEKIMLQDKLYLEPELSLSDLALKLKTNTSVLSSAINSNFGKNFNDFVNEYRVEEFKKQIKLSENQHYTLLAIAFDCGFNSKATFNRAFKKFTGQAPSRFEK
ncbi:helix-turn-helix domain-containing protein [Emticicia sp. SJ17W-69]|uniref:helix-turn-helix domain-containing protein n=1 Tax=Emticicia sp. SJ17W-69 TaxID=3421657 RepID=UPI003EB7073B